MTTSSPEARSVRALQDVLAAEHAVVYGYGVAGAQLRGAIEQLGDHDARVVGAHVRRGDDRPDAVLRRRAREVEGVGACGRHRVRPLPAR